MIAASRPAITPRSSSAPDELVSSVHDVMRSMLQRIAPTLEAEHLSMGQFWALHLVSSLGQTSLTSVARHLSVAPPTVCANVDQLVRVGLVARHRSEIDRRSVELTLTPAGRRVEARIWRAIGRVMRAATADLPPADVATATRVFRDLRERLDTRPPPFRGEAE